MQSLSLYICKTQSLLFYFPEILIPKNNDFSLKKLDNLFFTLAFSQILSNFAPIFKGKKVKR